MKDGDTCNGALSDLLSGISNTERIIIGKKPASNDIMNLLNTSEVFSEINASGNILIVKDYLGSAFLPEWEFNGIGDMQPGEGYQVKTLNEDILNY